MEFHIVGSASGLILKYEVNFTTKVYIKDLPTNQPYVNLAAASPFRISTTSYTHPSYIVLELTQEHLHFKFTFW
jgi:hypothetical protein